MSKAITVRVDDKGRLMIPSRERKEWGVEPGAVFFIERKGDILQLARAENPFDGLARHAQGRLDLQQGRGFERR